MTTSEKVFYFQASGFYDCPLGWQNFVSTHVNQNTQGIWDKQFSKVLSDAGIVQNVMAGLPVYFVNEEARTMFFIRWGSN
jgi:hypothetical protein